MFKFKTRDNVTYAQNKNYIESQFKDFSITNNDGFKYNLQIKGKNTATNWIGIDESQLQAIKHILIGEQPKENAVTLLLSDARGQYIPRDLISDDHGQTVNLKNCEIWHIKESDATELLNPENEYYWDTWTDVLNSAYAVIAGDKYTLHHDGNLWALCLERMTDEECENFGFEIDKMTTAHQITEAQARAIMGDDDADYAPFRTINEFGKTTVQNWLGRVAKTWQNADAWFSDAEQAANDVSQGESIIIEMRGFSTISGNPETLTIDETCFDWMVNE